MRYNKKGRHHWQPLIPEILFPGLSQSSSEEECDEAFAEVLSVKRNLFLFRFALARSLRLAF